MGHPYQIGAWVCKKPHSPAHENWTFATPTGLAGKLAFDVRDFLLDAPKLQDDVQAIVRVARVVVLAFGVGCRKGTVEERVALSLARLRDELPDFAAERTPPLVQVDKSGRKRLPGLSVHVDSLPLVLGCGMPKRLKKHPDFTPAGFTVEFGPESEHSMDIPEHVAQALISAHMAKLGAKGGKIGGKRRLETMSKKERSSAARKAAAARWSKQPR